LLSLTIDRVCSLECGEQYGNKRGGSGFNLTDERNRCMATRIKKRRNENASEVVRTGLRTVELGEKEYHSKVAILRKAIDEGDASGVARGNVFGRVRKALKLPAQSR
jgi:antitoxin ParD1/3/4